ncbi:hypothetical protein HK096_009712 [Nowakowskiella sp. JEL0078]|nr:hypothetical protein HK096_009712 [Nowakowskiella sp. JEL0078]
MSGNIINTEDFPKAIERDKRDIEAAEHTFVKFLGFKPSMQKLDFDSHVGTLLTNCQILHPEDRKLTLYEYRLLQGIPLGIHLRTRLPSGQMPGFNVGFEAVGNSVPPPLAKALGNAIVKASERWYVYRFGLYSDGTSSKLGDNAAVRGRLKSRDLRNWGTGWSNFTRKRVSEVKRREDQAVSLCWRSRLSVKEMESIISRVWTGDILDDELRRLDELDALDL